MDAGQDVPGSRVAPILADRGEAREQLGVGEQEASHPRRRIAVELLDQGVGRL